MKKLTILFVILASVLMAGCGEVEKCNSSEARQTLHDIIVGGMNTSKHNKNGVVFESNIENVVELSYNAESNRRFCNADLSITNTSDNEQFTFPVTFINYMTEDKGEMMEVDINKDEASFEDLMTWALVIQLVNTQ